MPGTQQASPQETPGASPHPWKCIVPRGGRDLRREGPREQLSPGECSGPRQLKKASGRGRALHRIWDNRKGWGSEEGAAFPVGNPSNKAPLVTVGVEVRCMEDPGKAGAERKPWWLCRVADFSLWPLPHQCLHHPRKPVPSWC